MKTGLIATAAALLFALLIPNARAGKPLVLALDAPTPAYSLTIASTRRVGGELWVLGHIEKRDGIALQVITTISAKIDTDDKTAKPRYFLYGDTWNWIDKKRFTIVKNKAAFEKKVAEAKAAKAAKPKK